MTAVGFTEAKRVKLVKYFKELVKLRFGTQKAYSCEDSLELVIRDYTTIDTSEKQFNLDIPEPVLSEPATSSTKAIDLKNLKEQPRFQRVIVTAKVVIIE